MFWFWRLVLFRDLFLNFISFILGFIYISIFSYNSVYALPSKLPKHPMILIPAKKASSEEDKLFEFANGMRNNFNLSSLRFSKALQDKASKRLEAVINSKVIKSSYMLEKDNFVAFYNKFVTLDEPVFYILTKLKKSFFFKRALLSKGYQTLSVSYRKVGYSYYTYFVFHKGTPSIADSVFVPDDDFDKVITFLSKKSLSFELSREEVLKRIEVLISSLQERYYMLSYPQSISIFGDANYLPQNYLVLNFSNIPAHFEGLNSISFYFKGSDIAVIRDWLFSTFGEGRVKNESESMGIYIFSSADRICQVLKHNGGVFVSITSIKFALKFLDKHKDYSLNRKNPLLRRDVSIDTLKRLIREYSKKANTPVSLHNILKDLHK